MALAGMLSDEIAAAPSAVSPMLPREPHLRRKAKNCIFVFMAGGASQMDTFDYKPALQKYAGGRLPKLPGLSGEIEGFLAAPHRTIPSPFEFRRYGQSERYIYPVPEHWRVRG